MVDPVAPTGRADDSPEVGPVSVVALHSRRPTHSQASRTSSRRKRAAAAALLGSVMPRAMPKKEASSTALNCQTVPTPLIRCAGDCTRRR
jgi:hypothetical protein